MRALYNYRGEKIKEAGRATRSRSSASTSRRPPASWPRGRERAPARNLAQLRGERLRREQLAQRATRGVSLEDLFEQMQAGAVQDLNLVVKGDVDGSVEAVVSELAEDPAPRGARQRHPHGRRRDHRERRHARGRLERDRRRLQRAPERRGARARRARGRRDPHYRVIYQLTQEIEQALVGMLPPVETEGTLGEAEVRALFRVSRLGTIAGCKVTRGVVRRNAKVRVVRDGTRHPRDDDRALKRFKDDAREVAEGFECGILLESFDDVKEGDVLEIYETREIERTRSTSRADGSGAGAPDVARWRRATSASSPSSSTSPRPGR